MQKGTTLGLSAGVTIARLTFDANSRRVRKTKTLLDGEVVLC